MSKQSAKELVAAVDAGLVIDRTSDEGHVASLAIDELATIIEEARSFVEESDCDCFKNVECDRCRLLARIEGRHD